MKESLSKDEQVRLTAFLRRTDWFDVLEIMEMSVEIVRDAASGAKCYPATLAVIRKNLAKWEARQGG